MKGRSYNQDATANTTADEWVNGSWTVDCICGVNFDDGEEMVNCDECGVWVHTRCSRYVKGEKSFACDKCKIRGDVDDSEETEVAQLLVELPTKTIINQQRKQQQQQHKIKMKNAIAMATNTKLRTERPRPIEDRVHVQGVPGGGDSSLIQSLPLLQLWKSSGYIPKPFRFRYSDFPCWQLDNDNGNGNGGGENMQRVFQVLNSRPPKHLPSNRHLPPPPPPPTNLNKQVLVPAVRKAHSESSLPTCDIPNSKPLVQDIGSDLKNTDVVANSETVVPSESGHSTGETKLDLSVGNHKGLLVSLPADIDVKSDGVKHFTECVQSPVQECRRSNVNKSVATSSHPLEQDGQDGDKSLEAMSGSQFGKNDKNDEIADAKLECEGSEGSIEDQKLLSESNEVVKVVGHTSRTSGAIPPPAPSHHKKVSLGRSSLAAPAMVFSRSSVSDKNRSGGSQTPSVVAKRLMSSSIAKSKKENVLADLEKNDNKHERSNSISKDNTNPGISSTKTVSTPTVRQYTSVGKESSRQSSVKMSPVESSSVTAGVSETTGTSQTEHAPLGQNKNISSGVLQRGEKVTQSNLPSSNPLTSSNSPAGLSDEELALLLHQELNSSPRVPRVPRVRNAGSVPQLSTANMLNKRTTTSGGKDQNTFSRRKSKDGSRTPHEQDSEVRKVDKVPTSSILSKKSDASAQAEGINEPLSAVKKKSEKTCTSAANCGSFSADADERKNLSARVASEDGTGAKKGPAQIYRTLPGLIAEIMGSGRRMTYEELCNAVLPHWPNLRKHNGERYAYSSHSQAVLDCLRNRTEWARLVDRGPKTSSSRKKRKIDTEPQNTESEDGEDRYNRDGDSKSFESNKEEFPRGRRQVRKRKRVAPQGRNVKDGQKRRKMEVGSDDSGSFSNSSEDSVSSEEDSGGSGMGAGRSEVSGSSHGALQ